MEIKYYIITEELMKALENKYPNAYFSIINDTNTIIKNLSFQKKMAYSSRVIDRDTRYQVIKRQNWKCNQCGTALKWKNNSKWEGEVAHIDHIFPYSKRNEYPRGIENINELANLQALCPKCNLTKSKKDVQ